MATFAHSKLIAPSTCPARICSRLLISLLSGLLCIAAPVILHAEEEHDSPITLPYPSTDSLPVLPSATSVVVPPALSAQQLGDLYLVQHRYVAAIEAYKQAPADIPAVWNKMGMAYHHLFALEEARKNYEHALILKPHYAEALNNLGAVFYGEKDFKRARKTYKLAIRYQPQLATAYKNLGMAYFAAHDFRHGLNAYHQAITIDPQIFAKRPGLVEEAADHEQRISMHFAMAKLYAQTGRNEQAVEALQSAMHDGFKDMALLKHDRDLAHLTQTDEFRKAFEGRTP